jgi:DNA repair protein RadC
VLDASRWALGRIAPPPVVRLLSTVRRAQLHALRHRLEPRASFVAEGSVLRYLRAQLAHARIECFHILYLDRAARLIRDEVAARGCIDQCAVYSRQIVARALELQAGGLIMAHNHPSGDPHPSIADVTLSRHLVRALGLFEVRLHDHVILAADGHVSLRAMGVLDEE